MDFSKIFSQVIWRSGIGDNNLWGWSAVALYYMIMCAALGMICFPLRSAVSPHSQRDRRFWGAIAALFLLLGLARQFGWLRWLTAVGRTIAWQQGWYIYRTLPQQQVIQAIYYSCVLLLIALIWFNRHTLLRHGLVWLGVSALLCYLAVRAVSLHRVDYLLTYRFVMGIPLGPAIELGALLFIQLALITPVCWGTLKRRWLVSCGPFRTGRIQPERITGNDLS